MNHLRTPRQNTRIMTRTEIIIAEKNATDQKYSGAVHSFWRFLGVRSDQLIVSLDKRVKQNGRDYEQYNSNPTHDAEQQSRPPSAQAFFDKAPHVSSKIDALSFYPA